MRPTCGDCIHLGTPFATGDGYFAECEAHGGAAVCSTWCVDHAMPDRTRCERFVPNVLCRLRSLHDEARRHADELADWSLNSLDNVGVFLRIADFIGRELER